MPGPGFQKFNESLITNIDWLLFSIKPLTYDQVAPKAEFWIEYTITEGFVTPKALAEKLSIEPWGWSDGHAKARFLKEFRDAPNRSELSKSFIDGFCLHILRWFAGASTDSFKMDNSSGSIPRGGGDGFVRLASFLGHLINHGLVSRELVLWHIIKPLTLYDKVHLDLDVAIRASAIYQLFATAGDALLEGLLEPGEVQACFEILDAQTTSQSSGIVGFDERRFDELRKVHDAWLLRKEEGQREATGVPVEDVDTPVAFAPQDLPATHGSVGGSSLASQGMESPSMLWSVEFYSDMLAGTRISTPSPTLSISTISDLSPSELSEDIAEGSGELTPARHETFYLEDGNIEIMCGHTIFRIHSSIISFSSRKLRDALSPPTLLNAQTPEGCPRIIFNDSPEDFGVLLKMIYTPGFPTWRKVPEFAVFASLLRMTTKYGFSDVREQLLHSLEQAYPTKWEAYRAAKILGEDVFGSPKPHPNAVLSLFFEQNVKFAIPLAAYRAALGGFSSLISEETGTVLSRPALASTISGMETMRGVVFNLAYLISRKTTPRVCHNERCLMGGNVNFPGQGVEGLNKIYDALLKEGKGDVFSFLPLGDIFCPSCAKELEKDYDCWCAPVWEKLPCIFRVGASWDEI